MASYSKALQSLASKFGLSEEEKVLSKAAEFERLLQTKTIAGSNLSDTSKLVICLDLAAGIFGVDLDVKTAIKYSGLKPISYTSNRKTVENLLELNSSTLTIPQLCVTLQCTGVQEVATQILDKYWKCAKMELDLSLPQYVCMAVYQAARINKVKVSKVKINEKCRLKPSQWAKLEADWAKFVNEKFAVAPKKRGRPPKAAVINDENQEMDVDTKDEVPTEPETEPYEDWRRRMIETAYRELKELEQKERQKGSPKKTPLKEHWSPQKENRTKHKDSSIIQKENGTIRKELRDTSQKDTSVPQRVLRGTPQKLGTPQKESGSPRKESGTPRQESTTPQKELRSTKKDLSVLEESRKSPKKTPQKFSPYKTPTKGNGVRLLFPNYM